MQSPFFIVGATSVGKTSLAVELADRIGAEIVSADAFQIYRGFDLLTAKPTPEQQRRVRHHLIGCVPASEAYNVARYLEAVRSAMQGIVRRGCPVIVVGGSGLYVKALTHGLAPLPEADQALRAELERQDEKDLLARLRCCDPVTASTIDTRNKRRLVRALEVCLLTGHPFSSLRAGWEKSRHNVRSRGVFIRRDRDDLVAQINRRLDAMFAHGVEEVRTASSDASNTAARILGLEQIRTYLAGQIDLAACREQIAVATRQYAKRQITWFKRELCFKPVNATRLTDAQLLEEVQSCYEAQQTAETNEPFGSPP